MSKPFEPRTPETLRRDAERHEIEAARYALSTDPARIHMRVHHETVARIARDLADELERRNAR